MTPKFLEEPPEISSDRSRGWGKTSWVNPRKHAKAVMRSDIAKRDFRALEERKISLVRNNEIGHLQSSEDAGGVPPHTKVGHKPKEDARPVPGTPRKGTNMEAEEDNAATVDTHMWPRGPDVPFWKTFPPPLKIDAPTIKITAARTHVTDATRHSSLRSL
jgi:hypothetical protein